jgi:tetratricopeptide (TPR) repeat protein
MTARVVLCLAAAIALAAAVAPPPQPSAPTARERLERAYRASNRGVALLEQYDYPAAAEAFREALRSESTLATARLNLAIALLYAGLSAEALPEARAAAAAMPDAPQPAFVLGLIARADNRADDAEAAFQKVLEIDPSDAAANVNMGQLLLARRDYAGAIAAFRAAIAAEAYNATAAYGLATAITRSGDAGAGQEQMSRFQALRDSPYAVTYAQGYLQQGRYGEAIASTGAEPGLVDRASPRVRFSDASGAIPRVESDPDTGGPGSVVLFDADGDGDLDLLIADRGGARLLRNAQGRFTATTALPAAPEGAREWRAATGDVDNDGRPDVLLFGSGPARLLRQRGDGTFEEARAAAALWRDLDAGAASWVDVDHDGDVDLVTAAPLRLVRNNGNGTFADITREAGFSTDRDASGAPAALIPTDYDNRRDVDLLMLFGGRPPRLFQNLRDGAFRDVAAEAGLPQATWIAAAAAADVNKDGFVDFFFGRAGARGIFALSDGRHKFTVRDAPEAAAGASLAQFLDYDNDGLLDLLVAAPQGPRLLRNVGDAWIDETSAAGLVGVDAEIRSLATGDVDGDGDTDLVTWRPGTGARLRRNDGGNRHRSLAVTLAPRVSNRSALGAKVEIRAGSLRQMLEASAASPAVGPADLRFGLGDREAADVVRVLWPSGILQSELAPPLAARIAELDRKPSSCPYLYTWNGSRFEFVTDFLGGGEMGNWIGPRQYNTPDPDEYVRIAGGQLESRDGRYEIRITNELEEALFLDRVRLLAVDHPADVDVFPDEGLRDPPRRPFRLHAARGARIPARAIDEHGHDVRDLIAARDRRWPADFAMTAIRGYAAPHALTLDPGAGADRAALLLTGWTGYAFSADNVAAAQAGLALQPPVLDVRDASGAWRTVDANVGFPVGRPQTIVVELAGRWLGPSREVRLSTNMPVYWDQVLVDTGGGSHPYTIAPLEAAAAALRWRGFSAVSSPDGREPPGADYERVSAVSPWKQLPGAYTREGDVRALLAAADDMFVIAKPGDEIAIAFDAAAAPPVRPGWRRTFLLHADGFSKEMNIRSATPDSLGPLPFRAMSRYPYGPDEHYPRDAAHREHLERDHTRLVPRAMPSIDAAALHALRQEGR